MTITDAKRAVLRRRSRAVPRVDAAVRRLVADMAVTMRHAEGVGLAAVQIGVPLRVIVADTGRGLLALVNPRLRRRSGAEVAEEGCLSVPGVVAPVRRAQRVTVEGTLLNGRRVGLRAGGFIARILQHEIDHLNGVLFLDRVRASAIRRRPLRPAERRRGVRTAAPTVVRAASGVQPGGTRPRAANSRRVRPGGADRAVDPTGTRPRAANSRRVQPGGADRAVDPTGARSRAANSRRVQVEAGGPRRTAEPVSIRS